MPAMSSGLRKQLEKVCISARRISEEAAEKGLRTLAVGDREPHRSMTKQQKELRNRLRAHGRQLGDRQNPDKGTQELSRLISECAYEHWHRMLFARFLVANNVLIEPMSGESISLDEVRELARSRSRDWVGLAGEFAVTMLPHVFRQDDPVLEVQFAPEDRKALEGLLESLPEDVFVASDSLGWCYQFWQAERKDEVNASGEKIGAEELPAVTQLFTEDYMVDFLLDNTLGAWHAGRVFAVNPGLAKRAKSEDELRQAVALPGCPWKYLRLVQDTDGQWTPGAGTFDDWPQQARELRCVDPCMGSGHFVVAMFERLVALRLANESMGEGEAVAAVIRDNLFGLELDPRCTQIGAFSLALAAWRRAGYCLLPAMNLACSGLAPNTRRSDWLALGGGSESLKNGMARLYGLYQDAPLLGSLINPRSTEADLWEAPFHELEPLLEKVLDQRSTDEAMHEIAVAARGLAKSAEILAGQFTLVATNVPYLGLGKQDAVLKSYCAEVFPNAKADLATCFIERCLAFCGNGGSTALVTPQSWLFLGTYKKLRESLLTERCINAVVRLGPGAFETITGEVVNTALIEISNSRANRGSAFLGIDVAEVKPSAAKAEQLVSTPVLLPVQEAQMENADSRIVISGTSTGVLLLQSANSYEGIGCGDLERFSRAFVEVAAWGPDWRAFRGTTKRTGSYSGGESIIYWQDGRGDIFELAELLRERLKNTWQRGCQAWGKRGLAVNRMGDLLAEIYEGEVFDSNIAAIIPKEEKLLVPIWLFVSSDQFRDEIRKIDQSMKITNVTFLKVPFDLEHWQKLAAERYPNGLPKPISRDPTQWLFNGHPASADQPLHVAVARLLGYQWPRQTGSSFSDCPALGDDGLEDLADDDGIVPVSPTNAEGPAAERLRELLARAFGKDWSAARQDALLTGVDCAGASLEEWLRHRFFEQHCALFHHRPFIWHIWDGLPDGFHALVNYHKLAAEGAKGRQALEKLTYSYLGDWITRQKAEQSAGKEGADAKLAAALHLQNQLKSILGGEPPYDLFVRWKPLRQQAIGWEPDINDGVRLNIRPFMMAKTFNGKSIFRKAPKIKWDKDRGKEPERPRKEFPWFWGWNEEGDNFLGGRVFDGNRWNDLHYSCEVKRAARAPVKEKKQ